MERRSLYLNIISAEGLENVKKTYVAVTIVGGRKMREQKTLTDKEGGTSPVWNFPMKFIFDQGAALKDHQLVMKIRTEHLLRDRFVGEARVPLMEIMENNKQIIVVRQLLTKPSSGKPRGELTFSYQFTNGAPVSYQPIAPPQPIYYQPPPHPIYQPLQPSYYQPPPPPRPKFGKLHLACQAIIALGINVIAEGIGHLF